MRFALSQGIYLLELGGGVLLGCDLAGYWCVSALWTSINLQAHVQLWLGVNFLLREAFAFSLSLALSDGDGVLGCNWNNNNNSSL